MATESPLNDGYTIDPARLADARSRAESMADEAYDYTRRADALTAQVRQLQRTWGFDLCPAKHGEQCCGVYRACRETMGRTKRSAGRNPWEDHIDPDDPEYDDGTDASCGPSESDSPNDWPSP